MQLARYFSRSSKSLFSQAHRFSKYGLVWRASGSNLAKVGSKEGGKGGGAGMGIDHVSWKINWPFHISRFTRKKNVFIRSVFLTLVKKVKRKPSSLFRS